MKLSRSVPVLLAPILLLFVQCDKSKLLDEDIIEGILFKVSHHSTIHFNKDYHILHFGQKLNQEVTLVSSILSYSDDDIEYLSQQFKTLRRNAERSGYGKNPSGWEYYMKENNEQIKLIIDTLHQQVKISHEIYYDIY